MKILWLDMETTGLQLKDEHFPLEVGMILAKDFTTPLKEYSAVIQCDPQVAYHKCIPWCKRTHTENALLYEVVDGKPMSVVEQEMIAFVEENYEKGEEVVIAGNSIHFDRGFLEKWFPEFCKLLHYRMLDVTAARILFVGLGIFKNVDKAKINHRVLGDLRESIWELSRYKDFLVRWRDIAVSQNGAL